MYPWHWRRSTKDDRFVKCELRENRDELGEEKTGEGARKRTGNWAAVVS